MIHDWLLGCEIDGDELRSKSRWIAEEVVVWGDHDTGLCCGEEGVWEITTKISRSFMFDKYRCELTQYEEHGAFPG